MDELQLFNVMLFFTFAYMPYYITNVDRIKGNVSNMKQWLVRVLIELFYIFWWLERKSSKHKICNICLRKVNKSVVQRIWTKCIGLNVLRKDFWIKSHNILVNIYHKTNTCQQLMFCFQILQILKKLGKCKRTFWKLFCRVNMHDKHEKKFYLNSCFNTKIMKFFQLQNAFIEQIIQCAHRKCIVEKL